jgi:hypothetical protein
VSHPWLKIFVISHLKGSIMRIVVVALAAFAVSAASSHADLKPADTAAKELTVQVRHLDKKVDDWKVAETSNFRILHNQPKQLVDKVGRVAEETRLKLQNKWFGAESVEWDGKCSIYLHSDRKKYTDKAGLANALGHTRTFSWGRDIQSRSIHLPAEQPKMLEDVLPHEISHSVLAVRLQGKTPRWADEGMAMLAETPAAVRECLIRLPAYKRDHALFGIEILMQTEEAEHFQSLEYYSQSTSLVQYLTKLKGPQTFISFLQTSIAKDYPTALKQHYEIGGFSELQKRWNEHAFGKK